jgi:hypothetical protein
MSSLQLPGSRALKIVLFVLVALVGLEVSARIYQRVRHGDLPTYLPSHLVDFYRFYRVNPAKRTRFVRVNAQGFRDDDDLSVQKAPDEFRVFVMGGSTVWGDHAHYPFFGRVSNDDTIAHNLELILNQELRARQRSLEVRVINAGLVGYMLYQNLIYFNHVVSRYSPDLVISIDGHNDITYKVEDTYVSYQHPNEAPYASLNNDPGFLDIIRIISRYLEGRSVLFAKSTDWLMQNLRRLVLQRVAEHEPVQITSEEAEEWLRDYLWTVQRMDASVKLAGAEALFMLQPELVIDEKPLTELETEMKDYWYKSQYPLLTRFRPMISEALERESSAQGIWFEDLGNVFKETNETTYLDYCHFNALGSRIVARRIADLVLPVILSSDSTGSSLGTR